MPKIKIDPVTRIEGHLRIEAQVEGGKVTEAWAAGTMFRGIEKILEGKDAREGWIWAQRICGVCTTVHAIASVRAVGSTQVVLTHAVHMPGRIGLHRADSGPRTAAGEPA